MKEQKNGQTKEKNKERVYEKTLLYVYPHMKKMSESLSTVINTQARLSYRSTESAEALVERLLDYEFQSRFLLRTAREIELLLRDEFTFDELFVLEYRYFRRKRKLREYENKPFKMSLRTFYRRQHSVLKKFSSVLKRRGMDEKWFEENFFGMDWVMTVYKKVCAGKDSFLLGKFKNSSFFKKVSPSEEDTNKLPMSG